MESENIKKAIDLVFELERLTIEKMWATENYEDSKAKREEHRKAEDEIIRLVILGLEVDNG